MDNIQDLNGNFITIDPYGFQYGLIAYSAVNELNSSIVVEEPYPNTTLGFLENWRWVDSAWVATTDYRGHTWYNPTNTDEVYRPSSFDDAPPVGWTYWPPGENKVIGEQEKLAKQWLVIVTRRNQLLAQTDWVTARAYERGEPVPENYRVYRQALRDVTNQPDPFNIVWPVLQET